LRNCPSGGNKLPSARVQGMSTGGREALYGAVRVLLTRSSHVHRRQVADRSALMQESRPSLRSRRRDPDSLTPEAKILVGLTSSKLCSIMFSIAIPSAPDSRRGINLGCIILNGTMNVQPSTAGGCQMRTWGNDDLGGHPGLPLSRIPRRGAGVQVYERPIGA
jgi:hypothetical protein